MKYEAELNSVQLEAVRHIDGPLLVIAGAGSGKTRIITYRIANLIEMGIKPYSILGVTFTNKAAEEMKNRVHALVNSSPLISTFHSFCALLLRLDIHNLGYKSNYIIYDEVDSKNLVKQILGGDENSASFSPKDIAAEISNSKNRGISPDDLTARALTKADKYIAQVYVEYQRRMKSNNAVDFDDLLIFAVEILEKHPSVLKRYRERYRYVLVDEYQDTNALQYRLIRLLAQEHRNICAVGDPDQSIYQWRGADITNILNFEHDFPGTKVITLEQNYRSTKFILEAANSVIKHNHQRKDKNLWSDLEQGQKPVYYAADDDREETGFVANTIYELHLRQGIPYKDFTVFYRTNAQSRVFEEQFFLHKIPFVVVGNVGFYERKEIKDIVAYLRVLTAPEDSLSLVRIINTPTRGIGETTVDRVRALAAKHKLTAHQALIRIDEAEGVGPSVRNKINQFMQLLESFRQKMKTLKPVKLTKELISETAFFEELKKDKERGEDRIENVEEFLSAMSVFESEYPEGTLEEFLQQASLFSDIDTWNTDDDKVTMMTMHNSKGLEFPIVFVVGLEEGLFPHQNCLDSPSMLEEERRLFYVCLTRAKKQVYLTSAAQRLRYGDIISCFPSRFINEIPQKLLDKQGAEARKVKTGFFYDDDDEEQYIKPKLKKKETIIEFSINDRITHPLYGEGIILSIEASSAGQICRIRFINEGQEKTIAAKFARMTRL
jgi:DNA helicase II / ATP-dependent DNA helicase PcrA